MKNLILLSTIIAILFSSCEKTIKPVANFSADAEYAQPGEVISFRNYSSGYSYLEWDFGDGSFSNSPNPVHYYSTPGIYNVVLKVSSGEGVDYASMYITVDYLTPVADFLPEYDYYEPGEEVKFYDYSINAEEYLWEFGDGSTSNAKAPSHKYKKEGDYTVKLTVYNGTNYSESYYNIAIQYTKLEVIVVEWATEDLISNAEVTLYTSFGDWEAFSNPVVTATTDYEGVALFKNVSTISYYIDVWNSSVNNESLGYEDIDFIKTLPLEHARYNVFTAYVDYVTGTMKATGSETQENRVRKPLIKEFKRSVKESGKTLQKVK